MSPEALVRAWVSFDPAAAGLGQETLKYLAEDILQVFAPQFAVRFNADLLVILHDFYTLGLGADDFTAAAILSLESDKMRGVLQDMRGSLYPETESIH